MYVHCMIEELGNRPLPKHYANVIQVVHSLPGLRLSLNKAGGRLISAGMLSNDALARSSKLSGNLTSSAS